MSLFKNRFTKDIIPIEKMGTIKVGQIYKFSNGYHTKTDYYAEVTDVDCFEQFFITSIPGYHSLIISRGNNWDYHRKRMELVGNKLEFGHLILNQKGLVTHNKTK